MMIGFDRIRVESSLNIIKILDFKVEFRPNEHGKLFFLGLADEALDYTATEKATSANEVHLFYNDENGSRRTLFKGYIDQVKTTGQNSVYTIEIEALAATAFMDIERCSRSFQDFRMTYEELFAEVSNKYAHSQFITTVDDARRIPAPIIQHEETDWRFLLRMATHFNTVLYSDAQQNTARFYVGLPQSGAEQTVPDDTPYGVSIELQRFRHAAQASNTTNADFISYMVDSESDYAIGTAVRFRKKKLRILEKSAFMDSGLLCFRYRLARAENLFQPWLYNDDLCGLLLQGKVLAAEVETVKVHLDIDKSQSINTAYWFDYVPDTGSMLYCMPQIGTYVSILAPDHNEKNAVALGCNRTNGSSCQQTADPNTRYLSTENGNEMMLDPTTISFTEVKKTGGTMTLKLEDEKGITMKSHDKLRLFGSEEITLSTPEEINIESPTGIFAEHLHGMVTIENEIHLGGRKVWLNGLSNEEFPPFDMMDKETMKKLMASIQAQNNSAPEPDMSSSMRGIIGAMPSRQKVG